MKNEIHTSAKKALKGGALDDEIYDGDIIEACASMSKESIESFLDVPIRSLIALRSRKLYAPGDTWRKAALNLNCEGWAENRFEIIRYFLSDLKNNSFPVLSSDQELRIGFTGGAIYCKLGNHRIVAAKAWLANNYSEYSILKKAKCYYREICPPLKELMNKCLEEGSTMHYASVSHDFKYLRKHNILGLIKVKKSPWNIDIYILDTQFDTLKLVPPSKNLISRVLKLDLRSKCSRPKFKTIPTKLIRIMLKKT